MDGEHPNVTKMHYFQRFWGPVAWTDKRGRIRDPGERTFLRGVLGKSDIYISLYGSTPPSLDPNNFLLERLHQDSNSDF